MTVYHPMLAQDSTEITIVDGKVDINSKYFGNRDWVMEIKHDGARYILSWDAEGKVHFTSRHISVKDNLPTDKTENLRGYLFEDCPEMAGTVLDGEVVIMKRVGYDTIANCNECGYKERFKGGLAIECPTCKKHVVPRLTGTNEPIWRMLTDNGSAETNRIMLSSPEKAKERLKNPDIKLVYMVYDILSFRKPIYEMEVDATGMPLRKKTRKQHVSYKGVEKDIDVPIVKQYEVTDVTSLMLMQRKEYLEEAMIQLDNNPIMCEFARKKMMLSMHFDNSTPEKAKQQFEALVKQGCEGVMLKNLKSPYVQGDHSKHWQKVKKMLSADGVVMGLQRGTGKYKDTMGAIVVGQFFEIGYDNHKDVTARLSDQEYPAKQLFNIHDKIYFWDWKRSDTEKVAADDGTMHPKIEGRLLFELKEVCTISGMTDEQRNGFWNGFMGETSSGDVVASERGLFFTPQAIVKDSAICEFIAQEKTETRYRHPRFLQDRPDKNAWDCLFNS